MKRDVSLGMTADPGVIQLSAVVLEERRKVAVDSFTTNSGTNH